MLNTNLWWHMTEIPCTQTANDKLSLSYAMDFHIDQDGNKADMSSDMSNVDGLFAVHDIPEGEIVLTEAEMPDCELPRSDDPTLCVAELDIDGEIVMALVAQRDVRKGEWFSVEHDDEDDEEDDEDEDVIGRILNDE